MSPFDPATIPASAPAHTYALYDQAADVTIANNAQSALKWALNTNQTGRTALLNLTSDTSPTIVTTGTYVFTTDVTVDALTAGGGYQANLQATIGTISTGSFANGYASTAPLEAAALLSLTAYLVAGTVVQVLAANYDGVAARAFFHATFVQRIG